MPPRSTRSKTAKGGKTAAAAPPTATASSKKSLEAEDDLHKVCVLPKDATEGSQVVYLIHPATSSPAAFLFSPGNGRIFELTKVSAPRKAARSWLITGDESGRKEPPTGLQKGYVVRDADMLLATPFDPVFFLTPLLATGKLQGKASFRLGDDYLETLSEKSTSLARLLRNSHFGKILLRRLETISDIQDIGDDNVYRPSQVKLATLLVQKACRMIEPKVWSASMDEGMVKKELDIPSMQVQQAPKDATPMEDEAGNENTVNVGKKMQEIKADTTVAPAVIERMRLRKALDYLLSTYVSPMLKTDLEAQLLDENVKSTSDLLDFTLLNEHLDKVKNAKAEAVALRSLSDNISRKRGRDDDEAADIREEKKRKKEEDDKKAKMESRASKQLKKVDTTGMKKMSSFFTKAPTKKEQTA
jgi:hypothetical protein